MQMINYKTGVLPRMCMRMIAEMVPTMPTAAVDFVESIGCAFQIQDDLLAL